MVRPPRIPNWLSRKQTTVYFLITCRIVIALLLWSIALQGTSGGTSSKSTAAATRLFTEAQQKLRQGNLEDARATVVQGLKLAPQSVDGYTLLGIIYSQQKDYAKSEAAFEQALKLAPGSAETHNNLGKGYFAQQKLDLAAKEFRTALGLDPRHRDANYNLGLVLLNRGTQNRQSSFSSVCSLPT
jgi:Tfp pilus assembly protein PilF